MHYGRNVEVLPPWERTVLAVPDVPAALAHLYNQRPKYDTIMRWILRGVIVTSLDPAGMRIQRRIKLPAHKKAGRWYVMLEDLKAFVEYDPNR
jgi:hypothetical protein